MNVDKRKHIHEAACHVVLGIFDAEEPKGSHSRSRFSEDGQKKVRLYEKEALADNETG